MMRLEHVGQELFAPPVGILRFDQRPHAAHTPALLLGRHVQGLHQCVRRVIGIIGIHQHRVAQLLRCASESTQHQHAPLIVARTDELLAHEIHAVAKTADVTDVGGSQELPHPVRFLMCLEQHNRPVQPRAEAAVDSPRGFEHMRAHVTVGRQPASARFGDLRQHEGAPEPRVLLEQPLDSLEFFFEPFGVVQTIDTHCQSRGSRQPQLAIHPFATGLHVRDCVWLNGPPLDRDRIRTHGHAAAAARHRVTNTIDRHVQDALRRLQEVIAVDGGLESDDIAMQQAFDEVMPPRTGVDRLPLRPGNVPEADDPGTRQPGANQHRRNREVIVLDQDDGRFARGLLAYGVGKPTVDQAIGTEVACAKHRTHGGLMTQRPQTLVGEAVVVALLLVGIQPDAAQTIRRIVRRHEQAVTVLGGDAIGRSRPVRHPDTAAAPEERLNSIDHASGGVLNSDVA